MNRDHYLSKRLHHQHRAQADQQGIQEKQVIADSKPWLRIEAGEKTTPAEDVSKPEDGGRK